jgi:hypothetical protein
MRLLPMLATCAIVLQGSSPSFGQASPSKEEVIKRYQEGISLYDKGQYEAAYVRFAEANAVAQTPPILFNLARTEQLTGRLVDAARHFKEYLALPAHPKITADLRRQATTFLGDIEAKLGHIAVDAPPGTTITLDGAAATVTTLDVQPGSHTIVAVLGPETRSTTVSCMAGQTVPAKLVFVPSETPAAPTPPPSVAILPSAAPSPEPAEKPERTRVGTVATIVRWGLTGSAAVTIALGVGFDVASHSDATTAATYLSGHQGACVKSASATCVQYNQLLNDVNSAKTVSYVFYGVGIASALGAAMAWIFWPKEKQSTPAWVIPVAGPQRAGVNAGFRF